MDDQTGTRILYALCEFFCDLNLCARTSTDFWFITAGPHKELFEEIAEQVRTPPSQVLARGRIWGSDTPSSLSRVDLRIGYGAPRSHQFVLGLRTCPNRRFQLEDGTIRCWVSLKENDRGYAAIPHPGIYTTVQSSRDRCTRHSCDCRDDIQDRVQNTRFIRRCTEYGQNKWEEMSAWEISDEPTAGLHRYAYKIHDTTEKET